jgi:hypothetical protein
MNQKEAREAGLWFGDANAMRVLKRVRLHVVGAVELTMDERRDLDRILLDLDALGRKYEALWNKRVSLHREIERVRLAAYLARQETQP